MSVLRMGVQRADITLSLSITHFSLFFVHVVKSNIDNIEIALVVVGGDGDHLVISSRK